MHRAKRLLSDKPALLSVLIGIVLMALALQWRINPVEGSVIPDFLTGHLLGTILIWILLITCMPAWMPAVALSSLLPGSDSDRYLFACACMFLFQAVLYFLLGRTISSLGHRLWQGAPP